MNNPYRSDSKITRLIEAHFQTRPAEEQVVLEAHVVELKQLDKVGRATALEILWAVGHLMRDRRK